MSIMGGINEFIIIIIYNGIYFKEKNNCINNNQLNIQSNYLRLLNQID